MQALSPARAPGGARSPTSLIPRLGRPATGALLQTGLVFIQVTDHTCFGRGRTAPTRSKATTVPLSPCDHRAAPSLRPEADSAAPGRIRGETPPSPGLVLPGGPCRGPAGCDPPRTAGDPWVLAGLEPACPFQTVGQIPGTQSHCLTASTCPWGLGHWFPPSSPCCRCALEAQGRLGGAHTCTPPVRGVGGVGREEGQAGEGSSIWTLNPWPVIGPSSCQELLEVVRAVFTPPAPSPCPQVPWSSLGCPVHPSRPSLRIPHCSSKLLGGFATICMTPTGTALPQILASCAEADVG